MQEVIQSIQLPVNSVILTVKALMPTVLWKHYKWTKISGPAISFAGATAAQVQLRN
jgi:hypothetical protein